MTSSIDSVACAACGCICEDVTVHIRDGTIESVEGACPLCAGLLIGQRAGTADQPDIAAAVDILVNSHAPLVYDLGGGSVESQRAAIALTEALGGTIDLGIEDFHRASLVAMQSVGVSTCTLGEVSQRADLIVLWGADPAQSHPSLFARFLRRKGQFIEGDRRVISVGARPPDHPYDEFIPIQPNESLAAIAALRSAVSGVQSPTNESYTAPISPLAKRLSSAEYSVIFFGRDIGSVAEIESLFRLVRLLNSHSRCVTIGLGGTQCENVLTWQTGYPCCVNFALGYPRYDPARYSASYLLERGEVDSVVLVGAGEVSRLSPPAQSRLSKLPVIHVGFPGSTVPLDANLEILTGRPGVHCSGIVFRMDGVPINLRPVFDSPLPTTAAVLSAIQQGVIASCV